MNNNFKAVILFVTVIFVSTIFSCKSDDDKTDSFHPNGIKILTQNNLEVKISKYKIDNSAEKNVDHIGTDIQIQGIEGSFIEMNNEDTSTIFIKTDMEDISDLIIYISPQDVVFVGEVEEVNDNGSEGLQIIGLLADDNNNTLNIDITIFESQIGSGTSQIDVVGENAFVSGVLGTNTYNQVLEVNASSPNVKTFILIDIDGSENDDVNVNTGRLIREAGYGTHVPSNGTIASGGVDLFTSGVKRTKDSGATIGVHSWCCYEGVTADQLPTDSPGHDSQLAYFREMLGNENGSNFYFFTLQAAPFDDIHNMTDAELNQYQLLIE